MENTDDVDAFLKLLMQTGKLLEDFKELSKKKPNDPINKFKLRFVNAILTQANETLDESTTPFDLFQSFDEDDLPTTSDVVLILSQYLGCLKKYGRDNTEYHKYSDYWIIGGKRSSLKANMAELQNK